jgi:Rha family phage regulatory protein
MTTLAQNLASTPEQFVFAQNNQLKTTSLKVSEAFGKLHKDVLRKIEMLECSKDFNERNFTPVEYSDAKGEKRPVYEITKDGFMFLVMGFTGKKAAAVKEAYIAAFNRMQDKLLQQYQPLQIIPYKLQSVENVLSLGRQLIALKESKRHSEWGPELKRLNIDESIAKRMMNAAMRFSNRPALTVLLNAVPNRSILFELLSLEDEELIELSEGGVVAGLRLSDIVNMSVKQLRKALQRLAPVCQPAPMPETPLDAVKEPKPDVPRLTLKLHLKILEAHFRTVKGSLEMLTVFEHPSLKSAECMVEDCELLLEASREFHQVMNKSALFAALNPLNFSFEEIYACRKLTAEQKQALLQIARTGDKAATLAFIQQALPAGE